MGKPQYYNHMHPADKVLGKLNYRDLKIAVIVKGMEFNDVVEGYHGALATYYKEHFGDKDDLERLEDFDVWMDKQLESRAIAADDPLRQFRLSSVLNDETQNSSIKRGTVKKAGIKVPKKVKPKVEKNKVFGIRKGTKKECTMELVSKLKALGKNIHSPLIRDRIVEKVISIYPEANEKSIKIWILKARKELS